MKPINQDINLDVAVTNVMVHSFILVKDDAVSIWENAHYCICQNSFFANGTQLTQSISQALDG